MSFARDLQASAWDAECRRDLDMLLAHFHADATFHPAGGAPQQGHAAIRAMTEEFYSAYPELEVDIRNEWSNEGSSAVFEFVARITNNDGKRFTLEGVILVEIVDGKFSTVRYYEDAPVLVEDAG